MKYITDNNCGVGKEYQGIYGVPKQDSNSI